jgi:hypothetical protein
MRLTVQLVFEEHFLLTVHLGKPLACPIALTWSQHYTNTCGRPVLMLAEAQHS